MILKNGQVLWNDKLEKADIHIKQQKIVNIAPDIMDNHDDIMDMEGKYLIPGGIDPHTHFNIFTNMQSADDYRSGSIAALYGGTTSIIDHPGFGPKGCSLFHQIDKYRDHAKYSLMDYSFHGVIQHVDEKIFEEMKALKSQGISSFKIYLTYTYKLADKEILALLKFAKELGLVICVHAENHEGIEHLRNYYSTLPDMAEPVKHVYSRPNILESEAVYRLLSLCETVGFEFLYLVHMSAKESFDVIRLFKKRNLKFYVETCPQYLFLDDSCYSRPEGYLYILSPPLRNSENAHFIKQAIQEGLVDTIGTDHCSFTPEQKKVGLRDFKECPNGIPGVQEKTPLMFTEYLKGVLSAKQFVELNSSKSAEIFRLASKGKIAVGMDADIVSMSIKKGSIGSIYSKAGYSCYENYETLATVADVFLRGALVIRNGKWMNNVQGNFIQKC